MKKKCCLFIIPALMLSSCGQAPSIGNGFTKVDYEVKSRERYDNRFGTDKIPEQWENYGVGDPYLYRFNGEYYLFSSTRDGEEGYKCWKSHDLIHFEYLGLFQFLNKDGTTDNQLGQYAPEVYYWNGDFYCYGSPAGKGHYIYKSVTGLPYGDYKAVTDNIGLSIDGSVFIDDDESMTFLTGGNGGIMAYEMDSMTNIRPSSEEQIFSPMIKWTEGPYMMKHNGTYFLTYAGNHVKSKGYRINYSYSNDGPFEGFNYPANNSIALKTLGDQVGLGHSSTVLGPNLDSYYIAYHNLVDGSGPIRSFNINRLLFAENRMTINGPTDKGALIPLLPDFVSYDLSNMEEKSEKTLSKVAHNERFSVEYNFSNVETDGSMKLYFSVEDDDYSNYITIVNKEIKLYVNGGLIETGTLKNTFDFTKLHTIRLNVDNGHYRVFFDNMMKIDITDQEVVSGGKVGYSGVGIIGTTTFSNEAFDSSEKEDPKVVEGQFFATSYLDESKLTGNSKTFKIPLDNYDKKLKIYRDSSAVSLANVGDYLLYPIDVLETGLYGLELTFRQSHSGAILSLQIDNHDAIRFTLPAINFASNMNEYEHNLQFIKTLLCETEIAKGLHTLKIELVSGVADIYACNLFKDSKYLPNYQNDLSTYIDKGANYLSLWKIAEKDGVDCHKAKAGANNMVLLGDETLTDYEVEVDINIEVSAGSNAAAGIIVRGLNASLYSGYVDQSSQGYFVGFNNGQIMIDRMNYATNIVGASTGPQYSLNKWHRLKVICQKNLISVYFDGVFATSYTDPYPYSHGLVALYSINAESYYKNLSIKGI